MNAPAERRPGFTEVQYGEAIERARSLIPLLRDNARATEARGDLMPEVERALHDTGLFRICQPKRWGGMELDFMAMCDVPFELARGCASTSWTYGNYAIHHWMLAMWDERAQEEVWGENPDARIASGIAFPQGRAEKVDGGYRVSGTWNFSSGSPLSDWNMLAALLREGDKVVGYRMCLLHRSEYELLDDWQVLGMRGTGRSRCAPRTSSCPSIAHSTPRCAAAGRTSPARRSTRIRCSSCRSRCWARIASSPRRWAMPTGRSNRPANT